jgi:hypothetical protein
VQINLYVGTNPNTDYRRTVHAEAGSTVEVGDIFF